jgi:uncharacterized membrane protein
VATATGGTTAQQVEPSAWQSTSTTCWTRSTRHAPPEQRRSIQATLDPLFERAQGFEGTRDTLRDAYHAEWRGSTFDAAKLNASLDKEVNKLVPFLREMTEAMAEVHAVLSPEQRELLAQHEGRHQKRHNWGHGRLRHWHRSPSPGRGM